MQRRTAAMTATVAGLVLTGSLAIGVAPSYASTAHASSAKATRSAPKTDGAKALCRRVPKLERRVNKAVTRLDAGAGTPGSIARLQDRVNNATSEGHTAVAKLLGDRLTYRKSLLPNLKQRQTDLKSVADWCLTTRNSTNSGSGTGSSTSSSAS
ncbi:hypothetical protein POF50_035080 [Streptomyces sp. SL13]|jgi:hypothetical protein|uniref:Secreted protein n=1 Tax=Streptantibioticus silvisoli TaxID=2705255 RepID=A0AA90H9U3_9ACTN|nr:hypothetical protein [Streptantibioticus silvisoli]MDI5967718.1 hypothetical protein [Streptantibioticus silvisoli]MDI5974511.1 hypothetical protein [Streptantibioticus silvisoli]